MARDHGRIRLAIWSDPHFRALTSDAQRAYFLALTQPGLSYAGVVPYTLRRWAGLARDSTITGLRKAVASLEAARFVCVDESTEELLVRSFVRNDGVLESPNVAKAFVRDWRTVQSPELRAVVLVELQRLAAESPPPGSDKSWAEVLPPLLREGLPEGLPQGFTQRFPEGLGEALPHDLPAGFDQWFRPVRVAPAPAPSLAPRLQPSAPERVTQAAATARAAIVARGGSR
jgi:hypothetical protein